MQKQSLHPAFRIPLPDNGGNNCLSLGYTEMIVRVCNAFLSIPGLQISDNNAKLIAEAIAAGGSAAGAASDFHPFKIYPTPQAQCVDPATFGRNFSVRGGLVEFYSKFYVQPYFETISDTGDGGLDVTSNIARYAPHYRIDAGDDAIWRKVTDANFAFLNGKDIYQNATTDVGSANRTAITLVDGTPAEAADFNATQFVLPATGGTNGAVCVGFWIEITEGTDVVAPFVQIKCQSCDAAGALGRATSYWPTDKIVFPIGIVRSFDLVNYFIEQLAFDHFMSRERGAANTGGEWRFRGDWDSAALSGQVFYSGDVVYVDDTGTGGTTKVLLFNASTQIISTRPTPGATWFPISVA